MKKTKMGILGLCALAIALAVTAAYLANQRAPRTLTMAGTSRSGTAYCVYAYGVEKGIFRKHGVNVSLVLFKDVYTMTLSFISGSVDAIPLSPSIAASTYNEGEKFRIAMALSDSAEHKLLARPEISDIYALKGCKLGVHGRTSDDYNVMKWYFESKGIDIENDMEVVEIRTPANLVTSYMMGQLDAVVLWGGYAYDVESAGASVLLSTTQALKELIGYAHYLPVFVLRDDFLDTQRTTADNFLRAVREIAREVTAHPDEAAEIVARYNEEPVEKTRAVIAMTHYMGDLDEEVKEGILAFFDYAVQKGFLTASPGDEIFYDDWR